MNNQHSPFYNTFSAPHRSPTTRVSTSQPTMAYRRYKKKARRYAKKASRAGFRKKNQGYMARAGRKAPMSSRGWKNIVKGAKPELKFFDTVFQNPAPAGPPNDIDGTMQFAGFAAVPAESPRQVQLLNNIAQGTDYNSRIGRKILIKSVYARMTLQPNTANTLESNSSARILMIWDLQPNSSATLPLLSDIFETLPAGSTTRMNTTVMMNLNNRERFVILWDKEFTFGYLNTTNGTGNGTSVRLLKKYKKVNLSVTYSGTGSSATRRPGVIATGALYLVGLGDAISSGAFVMGAGNCRIRYTDA